MDDRGNIYHNPTPEMLQREPMVEISPAEAERLMQLRERERHTELVRMRQRELREAVAARTRAKKRKAEKLARKITRRNRR